MSEELYRGFRITRAQSGHHLPGEPYEFVHVDYDGPGDDRCGFAPTVVDARAAIDDRIRDEAEEAAAREVLEARGSACGLGCGHCGACS